MFLSTSKYFYFKSLNLLLISVIILLGGCNDTNTPSGGAPLVTAEDRALLEEIKASKSMKESIQDDPNSYIDTGKWGKYDKGIINRYTTATSIDFLNNTDFHISSIKGQITFFTESGGELGTVPFSASGELSPNSMASLEVSSGEVSGDGETARIFITSVRVSD